MVRYYCYLAVVTGRGSNSCMTEVTLPDSKVHGANMGPTWGRQDPGMPHVGPMNLAIWAGFRMHGNTCSEIYFCLNEAINSYIEPLFQIKNIVGFSYLFGQYSADAYILLHNPLNFVSKQPISS